MSNPRNLAAYPSVYHTVANLWISGKRETVFIRGFETKNKAIAFASRWHSFRKVWMEERISDAPVLGSLICRKRQEENGTWTVFFEDMDAEFSKINEQLLSQLGEDTLAQSAPIPKPSPKNSGSDWLDKIFAEPKRVNGKPLDADKPSLTNGPEGREEKK